MMMTMIMIMTMMMIMMIYIPKYIFPMPINQVKLIMLQGNHKR
jgi:hypothetical protein